MTNYNLLNLSSYEFEILTRDILQKHLGTFIESFCDGADGGIDLRCSITGNTIIQCKRYKEYSSLKSKLLKEAESVKKLSPDRYIFVTTAKLNPDRKKYIFNTFSPYIKSTEDILGEGEINNLLDIYKEIAQNHYKLWMSSVDVLNTILHKNIINKSKFELDEIEEKVKLYVQNNSFPEAKEILKKENYVVISGIPGIGKSTLAEMLSFDLLAKGVDEFVYLSDSIEPAYTKFDDSKSQVFLFDDFLGRNFLENTIDTNEEKQIIKFIKKIKKSEAKFLVFTTREYILNQARQKFDLFDSFNFQTCIIDLSKYTDLVKGKILYNHLFFSDITEDYISELIKQDALIKIIQHKNYNPRIIETITNNEEWKNCTSQEFPKEILEFFNNPNRVWEHAFENTISELSRVIMYNLLFLGGNIEINILYDSVKQYINSPSYLSVTSFGSIDFKKSLKELENTFIKINKDKRGAGHLVDYQNPSIQDFLVYYIANEDQIKKTIIESAQYLQPLLRIFITRNEFQSINKLELNQSLSSALETRLINDFDLLKFDFNSFYANRNDVENIIFKLHWIVKNVNLSSSINSLIKTKFDEIIYSDLIMVGILEYIQLLIHFKGDFKIDILKIIDHLIGVIEEPEELTSLYDLGNINEELFETYIEENEDVVNDLIISVIDNIDSSDIDPHEKLEIYEEIEHVCQFDLKEKVSRIREEIDEIEYNGHFDEDDWREQRAIQSAEEKDIAVINDMFNSFER
ncbi:restriction endonuclease [Tenacibaculum sp.]|uniref:nSTAND3 domain-containing NTPase n=1 Tax=Tenacibaculum sp. TaxID=1906242 RepID=UPI003AA7DD91